MGNHFNITIQCLPSGEDSVDTKIAISKALSKLGVTNEFTYVEAIPEGYKQFFGRRLTDDAFFEIEIPTKQLQKGLKKAKADDLEALKLALTTSEATIFERVEQAFLSTSRSFVATLTADNFIPHIKGETVIERKFESSIHSSGGCFGGCLIPIAITSLLLTGVIPLYKKIMREMELKKAKPPIERIIDEKKPNTTHVDKIEDQTSKAWTGRQ